MECRKRVPKGAGLLFTACAVLAGPEARAEEARPERRHAVSVFAARMTDNDWHEVVTLDDVRFRDSYLAGVAVSRRIAEAGEVMDFEVEGQVVRHFGDQDHWEFNAVAVARWTAFPWNQHVPTSIAFGIGPSYATRVPAEEVARNGDSARLLVYWMAELEVGLPDRPWSAIARLHHRSTAYGLFAEEGGSNFVTLGLRWRL